VTVGFGVDRMEQARTALGSLATSPAMSSARSWRRSSAVLDW